MIMDKLDRIRYKKPESAKLECKDKSRTVQSFAKEADINNVIKKYMRTGELSSGNLQTQRMPIYGDFMNIDYTEMQRTVAQVDQEFMMLPAEERAKHDNNPQKWLEQVVIDKAEMDIKAQQEADNIAEQDAIAESLGQDTSKTVETATETATEEVTPTE